MAEAIVLTDGKAGHENQSKALARALGLEPEIVKVTFRSKFAKALSYCCDHLGIRTLKFFAEAAALARLPRPAAVIGTGSGTFYAAKALAKRLGAKCAVVLYPRGYELKSFDAILAPAFDRPAAAPNVIRIPANLVANDAEFYARGVEKFRGHCAATKQTAENGKPAVAVIVGGPNKCSTMSPEWMKRQLDALFAANPDCAFWVTTSRRTPPAVEATVDSYPWAYRLIYSQDRFNPIPAFVSLARKLYVTAESTGMLSEACTCGSAEVEALDNLKPGPHKFRRFVEDLRAGGYVGGNRKVNLEAEVSAARELLGL